MTNDSGDLDPSPYRVGPVKRALSVLSVVGSSSSQLSLGQISLLCQIPRSTVFKYLKTLEEDGFVIQDPQTDAFYLGPAVWRLSYIANVHRLFSLTASPYLQQIRDRYRETAVWGHIDGQDVVVEHVVEGSNPLRISIPEGTHYPAHTSALGKAILSMLQERWRRMHTPSEMAGVTDYQRFDRHLNQIAARGYAIENGECVENVWACAVPVMGSDGLPLVALGVLVPMTTAMGASSTFRGQLVDDLQVAARALSAKLGFDASDGRRRRS